MMKKLAVMLSMSLLLGAVAIGCKKDAETNVQETAPGAVTPETTEPMQAPKPILQEPAAPATEEGTEEAAAGEEEAAAAAAGEEEAGAAGDEAAAAPEGEEAAGYDDEEVLE